MKLPFDFGPKLIFRLGIPGMILAAATAPLVFTYAHSRGVDVDRLEVITIGTVFWGWIVSLADMPIYMLYEGRRFWPRGLRELYLGFESRRLADILRTTSEKVRKADELLYMESSVGLLNFPINRETGIREVRFPTRLGNLIASYETYTRISYGLDAIFYWPRLWVALDKDLREEIDNQQAIADSGIYTSFAFALSTLLFLFYFVTNVLFHFEIEGAPKPFGLILMSIFTGFCTYIIYRISLFSHAQFGELFKAVFDQHRKKLEIDQVVDRVGALVGDPGALKRPEAERYQMVSRYLRWHRIRPLSEQHNFSPEEWKAEQKKREQPTTQML